MLPPIVKHGKQFREIALRLGLEGAMRHTKPSPLLKEYLQTVATNLGTLPHAKLNFTGVSDKPNKQTMRYLKAECPAACGYTIRLTAKWARVGLPICPLNAAHGSLACAIPSDDGENTAILKDDMKDAALDCLTNYADKHLLQTSSG